MIEPTPAFVPPRLSPLAIFIAFFRFGAIAWGGPGVQLEGLRAEFVERQHWTTDERFRRSLSVYQALPGPEAHEMCCWLGATVGGRIGSLAAGLGFLLPGFLLMMLAATAYASFEPEGWGRVTALQSAFRGLQVAVVALVAVAAWRLCRTIVLPVAATGGSLIAAAACALQFLQFPFWGTLLAGGTALMLGRRSLGLAVATLVGVLGIAVLAAPEPTPEKIRVEHRLVEPSPSRIFTTGLAGGFTSFGGAYTAIPIVRDIAVGPNGWMTNREFVDGLAIGGVLPAPMVIFATFVGVRGGGWLGGVLATLGMFLPAFSFTLIGHRTFERLVEWKAAHAFLDGIACAACGLILATAFQLLQEQFLRFGGNPRSIAIALALVVAAGATFWFSRRRFTVPIALVATAALGAVLLL